MKRTLIQTLWSILTNGYILGFFKGKIFTGRTKNICVPGLNCYSCPGAVAACPIGSLQAVLGYPEHKYSFYILGIIMLFGIFVGRLICGFLCPFGFIQDLIYKVRIKKVNVPRKLDKLLRYIKYLILLFPVILFPILLTNEFGMGDPYFCKWICPAGTLEGGIPLILINKGLRSILGFLFNWKLMILIIVILAAIFIYRPFCKYLCPLGAFYSLFNKVSFYKISIDKEKCNGCKSCERVCKMNVKVTKDCNSLECIRCGECKEVCPKNAIKSGFTLK